MQNKLSSPLHKDLLNGQRGFFVRLQFVEKKRHNINENNLTFPYYIMKVRNLISTAWIRTNQMPSKKCPSGNLNNNWIVNTWTALHGASSEFNQSDRFETMVNEVDTYNYYCNWNTWFDGNSRVNGFFSIPDIR